MKIMIKRFLMALAFLFIIADISHALSVNVGEVSDYSGVVVARGWTKSKESYCQGGSDYYGLQTKDGDITFLNSTRDPINKDDALSSFYKMQERLKSLVGKEVVVSGSLVNATFAFKEHCGFGQCLGGEIDCYWIRVLSIKEVDEGGTALKQ